MEDNPTTPIFYRQNNVGAQFIAPSESASQEGAMNCAPTLYPGGHYYECSYRHG